jgi:Rieske Fe-S protein
MANKKNQSRREFLGKTLAAAAIVILNPVEILLTPKEVFASGGNQALGTFTIDLTLSRYAVLKNVDGSIPILITGSKPTTWIILTRTSTTTFEAVNRACTHQGNFVDIYNIDVPQRIVCPAHGSEFLVDGTVVLGPATRNLPNYPTHYDSINSPNVVTISVPTLGVNGEQAQISSPELYQNFPNPVKASTTIRFKLYYYTKVTLTVIDALGHIIAVLHDGDLDAGEYSFDFDTSIWSSGTYFYRLSTEGEVQTKQMVVVR